MFSHEHNLLPFSTPQSYALLSAESKAADATNNKERLDVCHDMCGAVPFFLMLSRFFSFHESGRRHPRDGRAQTVAAGRELAERAEDETHFCDAAP